ncbi:MAG: hypothetical protein WCJ95_15590 [Mariniphaga sp.]
MKFKSAILAISLFGLMPFLINCKHNVVPVTPQTTSLSTQVVGTYTGTGHYMPGSKLIGDKTFTCTVPDWAQLLKSGTGSAIVSAVNDSTVNITLSGGIYSTQFSENFGLRKNGYQIYALSPQRINFYSDTKSLELAFTINTVTFISPDCVPVNKYYSPIVTYTGGPSFSYTSEENWEFTGKK